MSKRTTLFYQLFGIFIVFLLSQTFTKSMEMSDTLPGDLPIPVIDILDNPSNDGIFMSPFGPAATPNGPYRNYFIILDSACKIAKYTYVPGQEQGYKGYHFRAEPNGLLSYCTRKEAQPLDGVINIVDTSFNILYSYRDTVNPYMRIKYYAGFKLLPNGNSLNVKYDFLYEDLTKYFPQGEPNGIILQALFQEIDKDKNVVMQWRSIDYLPVSLTYNAATPAIEYFHPNSFDLDHDGNILLSSRNLSAIIKINRNTGEIMWILGGKANQFIFIGENENNAPSYFSYQHDIRMLPNGNITLFDNGRLHNPQYSRAIEYELDQVNKTCKLVWEYRRTPDFYSDQFGNHQVLPNGNHFIAWGSGSQNNLTALQELDSNMNTVLEMRLPDQLVSQFIYKYPYPVCPVIANVTRREMMELNTYEFNDSNQRTGIKITWQKLTGFIYNSMKIKKYDCSPMNPEFTGRPPFASPYRFVITASEISELNGNLELSLNDYPLAQMPWKTKLYFRPEEGLGVFSELPTNYNSQSNSLMTSIASTGEFILAYADTNIIPLPPIVYEPADSVAVNIKQPVLFSWNPKGYFKSSQIQISESNDFQINKIDTTTRMISYKTSQLEYNKTYYWHVRTKNDAGFSDWSNTRMLIVNDPLIYLKIPKSNDVWDTTSHIIRWYSNLKDSANMVFKVELYRNDVFDRVIAKTIFSPANTFKWKIPSNIAGDSTYQIKVSSVSDSLIFGASPYFTIVNGTTGVNDNNTTDLRVSNYPNPVSGNTTFEIFNPEAGKATLLIYDIFGRSVCTVFSGYLESGHNTISWNTGLIPARVLFYKLTTGTRQVSGKLIIPD